MPGVVRGEDLAKCFASADLFFTPTVTGTLDLVFLEAMASGLPVVGPRAVAIPHVLTNGVNGQLYDVCDAADAALPEGARRVESAEAAREAVVVVDFSTFEVRGGFSAFSASGSRFRAPGLSETTVRASQKDGI